jgi:hypothetical protein
MQADLPNDPEPAVAPDAWIRSGDAMNVHCSQIVRVTPDLIEARVAEFLASGGEITTVPIGASAEMDSHFNNSVVASGTKAGAMYEARAAHNRRVSAKLREQDARDVEKLARHLPHVRTARELCRECRVSYDKLDRLLRAYFPGDPVAAQYTKMTRDEREEIVRAKYRDLRATMAQSECAKALHMHHAELKRIVALYGLDRPASTAAQRWNNPGRPATKEQAELA